MLIDGLSADDVQLVILALGEVGLVGGRALVDVAEEGVGRHDVGRVVRAARSHYKYYQ